MSAETPVTVAATGAGWKRAVALFALVLLTSIVPAGLLVAVPLLVLIGLGGVRSWSLFVATIAAMLIALAGPRDALWFAERGWAVMLGGVFAAVSLVMPRWRLTSRALAAVGGAALAGLVFFTVRAGAWASIDWSMADRLQAGLATWLDALAVVRQGEPASPALVSAVYRTIELQTSVFPAVVALESMAALGVVWWLYRRLVHRDDEGLDSVQLFRFNDHLVWLMIIGMVLVVARAGEGVTRIGANVAVFMGALYAIRGTGVIVFLSGGLSFIGYSMFALGILFAAPLVIGFAVLLGIADTWLDLRARVGSLAA
jgi:hypothetical protein